MKLPPVLPIVQRELRAAAKDPKLYRRRLAWGIVQSIFACFALLAARGRTPGGADGYFSTFGSLALLLCLLEGIRKTADSISIEKREGTLGLLFLSTLSGADVVLGKLTGAMVRSISVLLPFFPILAISLLMGGTTGGEFWRVALVLVSTLVASLCICLLISAVSRQQSIVAGLIALAALCVVPPLVAAMGWNGVGQISPMALQSAASDPAFRSNPGEFWTGLGLLWCIAITSVLAASFIVPRIWQGKGSTYRISSKALRDGQLLNQSPTLWLTYDRKGQKLFHAVSFTLLLAGIVPLMALWLELGDSSFWAIVPGLAAGVLILMMWVRAAVRSAQSMSEANSSGMLELVLSTPVTVADFLNGQWLALWRSMRIPAACVLVLLVCAFVAANRTSYGEALWTGKLVTELLLEVAVMGVLGAYMGLRCKTRAAAVVYTLLLGGLVPWITCVFTVAVQVIIIARSLDLLKLRLARIRNGTEGMNLLNPPLTAVRPGVAPPVIR